jgi:hypothetical protein
MPYYSDLFTAHLRWRTYSLWLFAYHAVFASVGRLRRAYYIRVSSTAPRTVLLGMDYCGFVNLTRV